MTAQSLRTHIALETARVEALQAAMQETKAKWEAAAPDTNDRTRYCNQAKAQVAELARRQKALARMEELSQTLS